MIGRKAYKPKYFSFEEVDWCNTITDGVQNGMIADKGDYYEIVPFVLDDKRLKQQEINTYQQYLDETDWYVIRFTDSGIPIPDEVRKKREEMREKISTLRKE